MENSLKDTFYADQFKVKEGAKVDLKKWSTGSHKKEENEDKCKGLLLSDINMISQLQEKLYAYNRYSLLIVLQALDAAGKDGVIKHVMSGLNPQGVTVHSFKTPSQQELEHDYLWRHYLELPARGTVGIFNRSYYENVLVTRVHPEYILGENLPGIHAVGDIDDKFWEKRFQQINRFEKNQRENGTIILKFFLHISKDEQRKRFLDRVDNPSKNWKFSSTDLKERGQWKNYRKAYEACLENTSKEESPWYVIPADDKWFTHLVIANIIRSELSSLDLSFPEVSGQQKKEIENAKKVLTGEIDDPEESGN